MFSFLSLSLFSLGNVSLHYFAHGKVYASGELYEGRANTIFGSVRLSFYIWIQICENLPEEILDIFFSLIILISQIASTINPWSCLAIWEMFTMKNIYFSSSLHLKKAKKIPSWSQSIVLGRCKNRRFDHGGENAEKSLALMCCTGGTRSQGAESRQRERSWGKRGSSRKRCVGKKGDKRKYDISRGVRDDEAGLDEHDDDHDNNGGNGDNHDDRSN